MAEKEKAPHCPAAFINALAEEGSRDELIGYLQKTWNDYMQASRTILSLEAELRAAKGDAGQFVDEWNHGCDAVCAGINLWVKRCPHCGKPSPILAAAPQSAQTRGEREDGLEPQRGRHDGK